MTISSRCGLAMLGDEPGWKGSALRLLGRGLNAIDTDHCFGAIQGDLARIERTVKRLQLRNDHIRHALIHESGGHPEREAMGRSGNQLHRVFQQARARGESGRW